MVMLCKLFSKASTSAQDVAQLQIHRCFRSCYRDVSYWTQPPDLTLKPKKRAIKKFNAKAVERKWYAYWEARGHFSPSKEGSGEKFLMLLPPPNVTGVLHMGHVLTVTVSDILARWKRMNGYAVRWIPGFDHAGIATQASVLKDMKFKEDKNLSDFTPEKLLDLCEKWKDEKRKTITTQLRGLGVSLDWPSVYYTKDVAFTEAIVEALKRLHEEGLLFRDRRLVNWSPFLQSTLSNDEISLVKIPAGDSMLPKGSTFSIRGLMYYVEYRDVQDPDIRLTVATTRPETIYADVALAVNPADQRYAHLIGRQFLHPLNNLRVLPVVGSDLVEPDFGTGALKVTPAHDHTDWKIGKQFHLPMDISCIDKAGNMNIEHIDGVKLSGLRNVHGAERFRARNMVANYLSSRRIITSTEQAELSVPCCDRTGDVVEPMIREHWFVKIDELARKALDMTNRGEIVFDPEYFKAEWEHWHSNPEEWCLSRQIVWGHPIPAYYCRAIDEWTFAGSPQEAERKFREKHPEIREEKRLEILPDGDVLDTWFSSALIPLVVAGWPKTPLNPERHPVDLMISGHDILGFWIARMALMWAALAPAEAPPAPFPKVLLHPLIRDDYGDKMSKSKGNTVDPMEIVNGPVITWSPDGEESTIWKDGLGADAVRLSIVGREVKGNVPLHFGMSRALDYARDSAKFCDKIWNSFVFIENLWNSTPPARLRFGSSKNLKTESLNGMDLWLISRLRFMLEMVEAGLNENQFHLAKFALQQLWVNEFCDLYIETVKVDQEARNAERLAVVSDVFALAANIFVRALAPFAPYISEEIFHRFDQFATEDGSDRNNSVHEESYPKITELPERRIELEKAMVTTCKIMAGVRSFRDQYKLSMKHYPLVGCLRAPSKVSDAVTLYTDCISGLTNTTFMDSVNELDSPQEEKWKELGLIECFIDTSISVFLPLPEAKRTVYLDQFRKQLDSRVKKVAKLEAKRAGILEKIPEVKKKDYAKRLTQNAEGLKGQIEKLREEIVKHESIINTISLKGQINSSLP